MDNSIYKQCSECGQTKHISEFSKSYPKRCKACVAEHTREVRAKEKENRSENMDNSTGYIKAVFKGTGEAVMVRPCKELLPVRVPYYETENGRHLPVYMLEFENEIDWEQRRYEIAKVAMAGNLAAPVVDGIDPNPSIQSLARHSVMLADALIEELKKGGQNEE